MQDTRATDSDVPEYRYNAALAARIEQRWQRTWAELGTFHAPNPVGPLAGDTPADKLFIQEDAKLPAIGGDRHDPSLEREIVRLRHQAARASERRFWRR